MVAHLDKILATSLVVVCVCGVSRNAGATGESRRAYEARSHYFALKDSKERQKYRHNWLKVIAGFSRVANDHPKSPEAPSAVYTAAELWSDLWAVSRRESDLEQTLAAYERVVHAYPESSLADDALWHRCQIYLEKVGNRAAAARAAREIVARYPRGDMFARAQKLTQQLADVPIEQPETKETTATATGNLVGRREGRGPVPEVTAIKHWSNPAYTRVAVYLTGPAHARSGSVPADSAGGKPARVYVDINKARLSKKVGAATPVHDDLLLGVRAGQFEKTTVRVVLDLKATVRQRVMVMENPYRVVIDAFDVNAQQPKPAADVELRGRRVVIDPGHGGKDGGANGPGKITEKQITLAISKQVVGLLEKAGVDVTLTRSTDVHMPLEERTAIANRTNADLFVSIHANAMKNQKVRGVETYYLNVTDDAYALRLAAMENKTSEEHVSDLQLILADLATKVNTEESAALARGVQSNLMKALRPLNPKTKDLGVKASLFYVLLGARMPSILIETGFLSHKHEGKLLARADYQKAAAKAIAEALLAHLKSPPEIHTP
ncbi:N-acetylmuramoyl-L-alanine amidase [Myxococcota bacterium]